MYIAPHGYDLKLKGDDGEHLIDISIPRTLMPLKRDGDTIYYDGVIVEDVYDVETEDHLDPSAWADDIWFQYQITKA